MYMYTVPNFKIYYIQRSARVHVHVCSTYSSVVIITETVDTFA